MENSRYQYSILLCLCLNLLHLFSIQINNGLVGAKLNHLNLEEKKNTE